MPFMLVGSLRTSEILEVLTLGGREIFAEPMTVRDVDLLQACLARRDCVCENAFTARAHDMVFGREPPASSAERWAILIAKAVLAERDPRTMRDWAMTVGASQTTIAETCRILEIGPHNGRDLARFLRAMIAAKAYDCSPEAILDISDRRTLKRMMEKVGPVDRKSPTLSMIREFLECQQFIDRMNPGVFKLRWLLGGTVRHSLPSQNSPADLA